MKISATILEQLRKKGFRMTKARQGILELFQQKKCPLSANDIHKMLAKKGTKSDVSTVYREVEFLESQNILKQIFLKDNIQRYELKDQSHHHHLICNVCDDTAQIELEKDLHEIEQKISQNRNFKIQSHSLEFYGTCAKCT